jgi:hypothetical protein
MDRFEGAGCHWDEVAGGVPMFIRLENQPLIKILQELHLHGPVTVAAFARKGQTSQNQAVMAGSGDELPTTHTTSADELEEIGSLVQMRGISWSKVEGGGHVVCVTTRRCFTPLSSPLLGHEVSGKHHCRIALQEIREAFRLLH